MRTRPESGARSCVQGIDVAGEPGQCVVPADLLWVGSDPPQASAQFWRPQAAWASAARESGSATRGRPGAPSAAGLS
jgi:hypothetical protein